MTKREIRVLTIVALALVVIATIGLVACGGIGGIASTKGSINVRLASHQAQSILPPVDLVCAEYVVNGTGPGGATIAETVVTGDATFTGLVPGGWTISATGRNAAHIAIGEGSGSTTVVIGQQSTVAIVVQEYNSPNGTYRLDVAWEPDIVKAPIFTGTLKDANSVTTNQVFTLNTIACTAASNTTGLHPGWYANVASLWDAPNGMDGSQVLSTGFAEAVRIAAGTETHGTVFVHAVQGYGSISINFTWNGNDPLVLTPSPAFGPTNMFATPVTFHVSADKSAVFIWYLRGQQLAVGDSYTLDPAGLNVGEAYRLDVIGFSVDGAHAGSGTFLVTHQAEDVTLDVQGTITAFAGPYNLMLRGQGTPDVEMDNVPGPSFKYTGVVPGIYKLTAQGSGMPDGVYWHAGGGPYNAGASSGDLITIPNPGGTA
ncbi:MAG: hypothetical protein ABSG85_13890, partial [Spirochaetia bacterium]